ncbi:hypothetical protein; putative membrane protein [Frankia alni ACN14a]|uniref:Membrane protein involved in the export of O-antigen and teichoic acid n=1 Tax=Frankia alni (strain DSM 45986 / CECT 9034 / ACN14a) TaxID=326424 RepID=Q0RCF1_FRAAA|nr:hypothetical protein; putative membrane protein [Frankia alni ACN14a]
MPGGSPLPHTITSTIDLSALQHRLRIEQTEVIARVEDPAPRSHRRRRRAAPADVESTQVVARGSLPGRPRPGVRSDPSDTGAAHEGLADDPATGLIDRRGAGARGAARRRADGSGVVDDRGRRRVDRGRRVDRVDRVDLDDLDDLDELDAVERGPGAGEGGPSTRSKAIWTLADQAISSATNAAISFLIARQVSDVEYGAFGIAYTLFAIVIGLCRGATCMPLSMHYSGATPSSFRTAASATTGSSFVFGIGIGVGFVGVGLAVGGPVGSSLTAMGFVLPGLLLQDAWRYVFFAMGRPFGAFLNDLVWAGVQMLGIWLLVHRGVTESSPLVLAWGASALVAALIGIAQAGFWPSPGATRSWLAENRTDSTYLAAEFVTVQGALQTSMLAIGAVGSLSTIGALQGARTLLGPTTVVGVGVVSFALPEFSKRTSMNVHARERAAYALSGLVLAIGAAWSLIFYFLPERYGQALLGDTWDGTKDILGLSILHYLAAAVPVGPACMVYALGKTKITFRLNAAFAPMLLGFPILGAVLGEARGAVIGFNIAFWAIAPVWFVLLRRLGREHDAEQAALRAARGESGDAVDPARPLTGESGGGGARGRTSRRPRPGEGRDGRAGWSDRGARPPARALAEPVPAGTPRGGADAGLAGGWSPERGRSRSDHRSSGGRRQAASRPPVGGFDEAEMTGGWQLTEGSARRDRSSTKRRDGNSSTKVRKSDVPEELRREPPRPRQVRTDRDRPSPRGKSGDSERGIGSVDDVDGRGLARGGQRDGHRRGTGPRRGRGDT